MSSINFDPKWVMAGISGIGLIVSIATGGNNLGEMHEGRDAYQSLRRSKKITEISEQKRLADQAVAEARIKTCIPYVSGNPKDGFKFPTLHESLVIRDRVTNLPLPDGYFTCDAHGGVAVIRDGKPTDIKYTGNRKVVKERLARYRGGQYQQPLINNYSQPHVEQ